MTCFYIVRHGETLLNQLDRAQGWTDSPLTVSGEQAAKELGKHLSAFSFRDILHEKCMEIPCAENILEMPGIGERILSGILAEMGDIDRFDDVREIQKLSGMGLVACSSGKHKGETKISHRGRKKTQVSRHQF